MKASTGDVLVGSYTADSIAARLAALVAWADAAVPLENGKPI